MSIISPNSSDKNDSIPMPQDIKHQREINKPNVL